MILTDEEKKVFNQVADFPTRTTRPSSAALLFALALENDYQRRPPLSHSDDEISSFFLAIDLLCQSFLNHMIFKSCRQLSPSSNTNPQKAHSE